MECICSLYGQLRDLKGVHLLRRLRSRANSAAHRRQDQQEAKQNRSYDDRCNQEGVHGRACETRGGSSICCASVRELPAAPPVKPSKLAVSRKGNQTMHPPTRPWCKLNAPVGFEFLGCVRATGLLARKSCENILLQQHATRRHDPSTTMSTEVRSRLARSSCQRSRSCLGASRSTRALTSGTRRCPNGCRSPQCLSFWAC